jgi:hypothetical protein
MNNMPYEDEDEDDGIFMCPVYRCRHEGSEKMALNDVFMFYACPKHAEDILIDNWVGWRIDRDNGKGLVVKRNVAV